MRATPILLLTLGLTLGASSAHAQPSKDDFKKKYYTWEEGAHTDCKPKEGTPMATLLRDPYSCYLDLDKCKASLDAATGKLPKGMVQLFSDLLVTVPSSKGPDFAYSACNRSNPEYIHSLGIQGLGYAQATQHFDQLKLFIEKYADKMGHITRVQMAQAVFWMGDREKGPGVLKTLLALDGQTKHFKGHILEYLKTWESDAGIDFCSENLKSGKPDDLMEACVSYLGARKHKPSLKLMIRRMENMDEHVVRALGQLGDKGAIKTLEAYLDDKDGDEIRRTPALVALINLGKKNYLKEYTTVLEGKPVLSAKEKERAKKRKGGKQDVRIDENQMRVAAMEAVNLRDAKAIKAISKQLQKNSKFKGKKWESSAYATIALAQMGDAKAINSVAGLLEDPKDQVRMAALDTIGGRFEVVGSNWRNRGTGLVASTSLIKPLSEMYEMESKEATRSKIARAIAYIKAGASK